MKERKTIPVGALFMILVLALASLGVGYGLWSTNLTVEGYVVTGDVDAEFVDTFTDDDNQVDDNFTGLGLDSMDTGDCPISVSPGATRITSCDPAESGHDRKLHYDKDVSECFSEVYPDTHMGAVRITNGYPSYYCTAFFFIKNTGSVPVKIVSTIINGALVIPSETNEFDLDKDGKKDLSIHLTDIEICQQIDPGDTVMMDIDQHVLQDAPQGVEMEYEVSVQLNQWNESKPCTFDKIIDADGTATRFSGDPGAREVTVGNPLKIFPVVNFNDSGLDMFDNDGNNDWTFGPAGDDLHLEGTAFCATGVRDGFHDLGKDCKVLDIDNGLVNGQPVSCDLEVGAFCVAPLPSRITYYDTNNNNSWDDGEDIVYDANNNGIFD